MPTKQEIATTDNAMTALLQAFNFEGSDVRILDRNGDPWFVLVDVCRALEIVRARDAARQLDEDEKTTLDLKYIPCGQ